MEILYRGRLSSGLGINDEYAVNRVRGWFFEVMLIGKGPARFLLVGALCVRRKVSLIWSHCIVWVDLMRNSACKCNPAGAKFFYSNSRTQFLQSLLQLFT